MAKQKTPRITDTLEALRPYLDRALTDPAFRNDLKDALEAAREVYGPITKSNGSVTGAARKLASDKKAQKQIRRAMEDLQHAAATLHGKKKAKKRRGRKMLLLAGIVVGALYNPWTGPQTRDWLLERIAGDDALEPLVADATEQVTEAEESTAETVEETAVT
jgi:hypothetical protein